MSNESTEYDSAQLEGGDESSGWDQSPEDILDGSQIQEMLSNDELVNEVYTATYTALLEEDPELEALKDDPEFVQMVWESAQEAVYEEFGS